MTTKENSAERSDTIRLWGAKGSQPAYEIRDFLARSVIAYEWHELQNDEDAATSGPSAVLSMRAPRSIAADLRVWTVIRGPASVYGAEQEDPNWVIRNNGLGVVVLRRGEAGECANNLLR